MAASSRDVSVVVCSTVGHKIESIPANPAFDANFKVSHLRYETLCTHCGLSLEDIRKGIRVRSPKKG